MKVSRPTENIVSLKTLIIQLQLTLELSQIQENLLTETALSTQDPARDGSNWFGYTGQNPVNYTDVLGLDFEAIFGYNVQQDKHWKSEKMKGTTITFQYAACAIMCVSDLLSISPIDVNNKYVNNGNVDWNKVANENGYTTSGRINSSFTKDIFYEQVDDQQNTYKDFVNVNHDSDNGDHWVGVRDVVTINDIDYVVINPTSIRDRLTTFDKWNYYDNKNGHGDPKSLDYDENRANKGWIIVNGQTLVPVSETKAYVKFKKEKLSTPEKEATKTPIKPQEPQGPTGSTVPQEQEISSKTKSSSKSKTVKKGNK